MGRIIVLALLWVPLLPSPAAQAAVTCGFAGGTVTVTLSASLDGVSIVRQPGGDEIQVFVFGGPSTPLPCTGGPPKVDTTDTINVTDSSSAGDTAVILTLSQGPFAPGATDEVGTSDEIEFNISLSDGLSDQLLLLGTGGPDHWVLGDAGINLNAGEALGIDADIMYSGIDVVDPVTDAGADMIDGGGDPVTGGDFDVRMQVQSGDGGDTFVGGSAVDFIRPEGFLTTNSGDSLDGGGGRDQVDYSSDPDGVAVHLATGTTTGAGNDDLVSIEDVFGSNTGGDVLIGNGRRNLLNGQGGNDVLAGGPGEDFLAGARVETPSMVSPPGRPSTSPRERWTAPSAQISWTRLRMPVEARALTAYSAARPGIVCWEEGGETSSRAGRRTTSSRVVQPTTRSTVRREPTG